MLHHRVLVLTATLLGLLALALPAAAQAPDSPPFAPPGGPGVAGPPAFGDDDQHVRVELVWYEGVLVPGREGSLGVVFAVDPTWHIQAGAGSGDERPGFIPTTLRLELPPEWTAGTTLWPEPVTFTVGQGEFALSGAGYEGRALAIVPVKLPEHVAPGEYPIQVTVGYQACDPNVCLMPTETTLDAVARVVPAEEAAALAPTLDEDLAQLFQATFTRAPRSAEPADPEDSLASRDDRPAFPWKHLHWWIAFAFVVLAMGWMLVRTFQITSRPGVRLTVAFVAASALALGFVFVRGVTGAGRFDWVHFSPEALQRAREENKIAFVKFTADWCLNCQVNERIIMASDEAVAALSSPDVIPIKVDLSAVTPEEDAAKAAVGGGGIPLIAVYHPGTPEPVVIRGQLANARPVLDALEGPGGERAQGTVLFDFLGYAFEVERGAVFFIFGLALLAGFFMNFTPCVLPVVPLKIISLQSHAKDRARCFLLGVVFGLGIVALYAALGVLMAGLIGGANRMDWGAFFSHWWFTAGIGLVVGFMALGLLGLFTLRLPRFLYMFNPQSDTVAGSFFMGVFTAVLSTPCTGPLLGATVAWTVTQPPAIAFLTLVVMGLGMAFPYVLLTANPRWLDRLPRTGPGSELVKQVMGLLLLAVAAWFLGVGTISLTATLQQA